MTKIEALAELLKCEIEEIKEGYSDNIYEYCNEEYAVLTDEEADEEFYNQERFTIEDMGLDCFTDWAKAYIITNCVDNEWFEKFFREDYESYIEDIKYEDGRLEREMLEAECETEEDYLEYLISRIEDNYVEEFEFQFGSDYLTRVINEYNLLDVDEVVDYIKEQDGRGILASYDSIENEIDEYFIYRLN